MNAEARPVAPGPEAPAIGAMNANWALQALADAGIRVLDARLGGRVYRRVSWTVGPGAPDVVAVAVEPEGPT